MEQKNVQQHVPLERIALQEAPHVHNVQPENIVQQVHQHVPLVELENGVLQIVQVVVI